MNEETKEVLKKIQADAQVYIFNLLNFGENYTKEEYIKRAQAIKESSEEHNPFKVFTDEEMQMNIMTALEGYGSFGTEFIDKLIDSDKASAKNILEAVLQDYLDLQNFIETMTIKMESAIAASKDTMESKPEMTVEEYEKQVQDSEEK